MRAQVTTSSRKRLCCEERYSPAFDIAEASLSIATRSALSVMTNALDDANDRYLGSKCGTSVVSQATEITSDGEVSPRNYSTVIMLSEKVKAFHRLRVSRRQCPARLLRHLSARGAV